MSVYEVPLTGVSAYVPRHRLEVPAGTEPISGGRPGPWSRIVMAHDEDTTTLGVAAARSVVGQRDVSGQLAFATSRPAYERTSNAATVHGALRLDAGVACMDLAGGEQAAVAALGACARSGGIAVVADSVIGSPGSSGEAEGADAAAALVFGSGGDRLASLLDVVTLVGRSPVRWRLPGEAGDRVWSQRFATAELRQLGSQIAALLEEGSPRPVDVAAVSCWDRRAASSLASRLAPRTVTAPGPIPGHAGIADLPLVIVQALAETEPGELFAAVVLGDGAAALLFERGPGLAPQIPGPGNLTVSYSEYLSWRGLLERDRSGRPDPEPPSLPAVARNAAWKLGLVAARCGSCGTVLAPPGRVCSACGHRDEMLAHPLADRLGTVATFTEDHLAWALSKPVVNAVVDFDGGGRIECQVTDVAPGWIEVGARVRMVFRRLHTALGVHNYGWKATPAGEDAP